MKQTSLPPYFEPDIIGLDQFDAICRQSAHLDGYPWADAVQKNIVIYDGDKLRDALNNEVKEVELKAELIGCLKDGPGVFVVKGAYADTAVVDEMTAVFQKIVAEERTTKGDGGDHFGKNERIWNSIQKACSYAPRFVH